MNVGREVAVSEMKQAIEILSKWIDELENPREIYPDGEVKSVYPDGVPPMLSVNEIPSVPSVQFRAELAVVASKLEAIAST